MARQPSTTPHHTHSPPAARPPPRAPHAATTAITTTALGVTLAACGNTSDPAGNVASGPTTGDTAKIQATTWNGRKHRSLTNNDGTTHRGSRDGTHPHPTAQAPAGPPVA